MRRIIGAMKLNGKVYGQICMVGTRNPSKWDVSVFEVNGHRELSARNVVEWEEDEDWKPPLDLFPDQPSLEQLQEIEDKRLRSLKKAAQRAQTKCRRLIKASDFREMLTGTYRENQTDEVLFRDHMARYIKAMLYALPKFQYCVSFEQQERGAWHFHMATNKLPRFVRYKGQKIEGWMLPTLIWRGIVGEDNGLVFVGGKPRWGSARRRNQSIAKIASYVSKYIMKDYEKAPAGSKRYWSSRAVEMPKPIRMRFDGCALDELIRVVFEVPPGHVIVSHRIGHWGDSYWLCTEPGTSGHGHNV